MVDTGNGGGIRKVRRSNFKFHAEHLRHGGSHYWIKQTGPNCGGANKNEFGEGVRYPHNKTAIGTIGLSPMRGNRHRLARPQKPLWPIRFNKAIVLPTGHLWPVPFPFSKALFP
jgi:hypothetical protein